jgi:hypothetical protein
VIAEFRERPGADLDSVQQEIKFAFDRLGDIIPRRIPNVRIGVTETRIAHGHRSVPSQWRAVNHRAGVVIEQTRPADSKYLYLRRQQSIAGDLGGFVGPPMMRSEGQWHVWGLDTNNAPTFGTGGAGANVGVNAAANNQNTMTAVPGWFPEAGVITMLAMAIGDIPGGGGTGVPGGGEHGWIGIAPDSIVGNEHWPSATVAGSGARVVGGGSGSRKIRGGVVSVVVEAGSLLWLIYQNQVTSTAGVEYYGGSLVEFPNWGGYDDLRAVAIGQTPPAPITGNSAMGYCSLAGSTLTYAFESSFPASGRRLRTANDADANANQIWNIAGGGVPYFLYQWSRTVAPAAVTGGATILNSTDAVTDIEVL